MASPPLALDDHTRIIRNIHIGRDDLRPLLSTSRARIPGTPINAYGALLQQQVADTERANFIFFSSLVTVYGTNDSEERLRKY